MGFRLCWLETKLCSSGCISQVINMVWWLRNKSNNYIYIWRFSFFGSNCQSLIKTKRKKEKEIKWKLVWIIPQIWVLQQNIALNGAHAHTYILESSLSICPLSLEPLEMLPIRAFFWSNVFFAIHGHKMQNVLQMSDSFLFSMIVFVSDF